ncbi:hypothetical protein [Lyngbya aestuarii]|uniref:hypothetical protein n=1 Tax=Lyngbya aestuarii TaxID=118322 RepID=UPI00403DF88C
MWVKTELLQCLDNALLASQKLKSTIISCFMLFITTEELEIQGVNYKEASQITFHNKLLTRGLDFSKKARQKVRDFCQDYLDANLFCLVVESQWYLTVWIEEKNTKFTEKNINSHNKNIRNNFIQPSFSGRESSSVRESGTEDIVKKDLPAQGFADQQSSREKSSSLPLQEESVTRDSLPLQEKAGSEDISSDESSPNQQNSGKQRRGRRYRGISY